MSFLVVRKVHSAVIQALDARIKYVREAVARQTETCENLAGELSLATDEKTAAMAELASLEDSVALFKHLQNSSQQKDVDA